jgi:hypothetical protein
MISSCRWSGSWKRHPAIGQFNELAGFQRDDDGRIRLAKLQRLLPGRDRTFTCLLAELLSVPDVAVPALPPEEKKVRLFAGLIDWIHALAGDTPVLLVVEDPHCTEAGEVGPPVTWWRKAGARAVPSAVS